MKTCLNSGAEDHALRSSCSLEALVGLVSVLDAVLKCSAFWPAGERNGQYRHGERTKTAIAERQKFSALLKTLRSGLR
jgi:hypothetical protein